MKVSVKTSNFKEFSCIPLNSKLVPLCYAGGLSTNDISQKVMHLQGFRNKPNCGY